MYIIIYIYIYTCYIYIYTRISVYVILCMYRSTWAFFGLTWFDYLSLTLILMPRLLGARSCELFGALTSLKLLKSLDHASNLCKMHSPKRYANKNVLQLLAYSRTPKEGSPHKRKSVHYTTLESWEYHEYRLSALTKYDQTSRVSNSSKIPLSLCRSASSLFWAEELCCSCLRLTNCGPQREPSPEPRWNESYDCAMMRYDSYEKHWLELQNMLQLATSFHFQSYLDMRNENYMPNGCP